MQLASHVQTQLLEKMGCKYQNRQTPGAQYRQVGQVFGTADLAVVARFLELAL